MRTVLAGLGFVLALANAVAFGVGARLLAADRQVAYSAAPLTVAIDPAPRNRGRVAEQTSIELSGKIETVDAASQRILFKTASRLALLPPSPASHGDPDAVLFYIYLTPHTVILSVRFYVREGAIESAQIDGGAQRLSPDLNELKPGMPVWIVGGRVYGKDAHYEANTIYTVRFELGEKLF